MKRLPVFLSVIILPLFISHRASHAQIPGTDIFVLDFKTKDGRVQPGAPRNITKRTGYDNQPNFMPNGKSLLFTSIRADGQADIYRYDLTNDLLTQSTQTAESEYSPTPMPDGKHFSVVRVEKDSSQRLWKFPWAGGAPSLVLENVKPVGYHAWLDANTLALFVLGSPHTLQIADVRTGKAEIVGENLGRALHKIPRREAFSFVDKTSKEEWFIKAFELQARTANVLIKTLEGSEDCAWTSNGVLVMAKGAKLFQFDPARDKEWMEIADFSNAGLSNITRLAVSTKGKRMALVAADESRRN